MELEKNNNNSLGEKEGRNQLFSTEDKSTHQVDLDKLGFDSTIQQSNQIEIKNPKDFFDSENDTLVKNIVDTKITTSESGTVSEGSDMLKEFQEIDQKLNIQIESLQSIKLKQKKFKYLFLFTVILAVGSLFLSLFYQNKLDVQNQTIETPLTTAQNQLYDLQSNLILNQTKQISILLNKLAFQSSDFNRDLQTSKSEFESTSSKNIAAASLSEKQNQIVQTLDEIKTILPKAQSIYNSSPEFQTQYVNFLENITKKDDEKSDNIFSSQQLAKDSLKILQNKELLNLISTKEYSNMTQTDLLKLLKDVFNTSQLNFVTEVSQHSLNKTDLTSIFAELNTVAVKFDPNFSAFNINQNSRINFNSYTISANNMVNVNADIKSNEAKLFSLIADLDDAISETKMFQKIERTNYSQNVNPNGEFTSTVSLDIKLNNE